MRSIAAVLAAAALAAASAGAEEGDEEKPARYPLVLFDVSALVEPLRDFPGPRFELSAGRALQTLLREEGRMEPDAPERPRLLNPEELEEIVRSSDDVWDAGEGVKLRMVQRRLFVQGPEDAVRRLRDLLQTLEREASRSFAVRAVVAAVPREAAEALLGKPGQVLPAAQAAERLEALKAKGGRILADAHVVALAGQRVHVVDGRERSVVVDYDVEVAQSAAAADPIVEVVRDGLILDVRPLPSPTGEKIRLDFYVGYAVLDPVPVRFDPGNPALGPLDLPRLSGFRMEASTSVPAGDFLLLGPLLPSERPAAGAPAEAKPAEGKPEGKGPAAPPVQAYL
ncbi:MAG: hypothetical protein MUC63_05975, partial [Planctomycetes bacterium]|nr:hypothetical protein [Planctomycetota bacterium]